MNSLQIQYFLTVAKCLSFSRAAEFHYTSQPSISRQIAALEREIGMPLFVRDTHNVELTEAGRMLAKEFEYLSSRYMIALEQARSTLMSRSGELSIGYLKETNISIILPFIKSFSQIYPNITLNFEGYGFRDLHEKLIHRVLDIAFMYSFETADMSFVYQRRIYPSSAHIVISINHRLASKADISALDFQDESVVVSTESGKGADFVLSQCRNYGFKPKNVITSATSEAIDMYIEFRSCVAVMDSSNRFYCDPKFRFIEIPGDMSKISLNAVWRKDNSNPAISLFDNVLSQELIDPS